MKMFASIVSLFARILHMLVYILIETHIFFTAKNKKKHSKKTKKWSSATKSKKTLTKEFPENQFSRLTKPTSTPTK